MGGRGGELWCRSSGQRRRPGLPTDVLGAASPLARRTTSPPDLLALPSPTLPPAPTHRLHACRVLLEPVRAPRCRLDAGTWGTMGVGLGYAIAAAVVLPERNVVAVEGDSAFGFSGMECETICRWVLGGLGVLWVLGVWWVLGQGNARGAEEACLPLASPRPSVSNQRARLPCLPSRQVQPAGLHHCHEQQRHLWR